MSPASQSGGNFAEAISSYAKRGLMFIFFIMSLGWVMLHLVSPDASFVGRYAGGLMNR